MLNKSQKIHVFGALGKDFTLTKPSPKINSKKFLAFLIRLKKHNPKLCIIIDNGRWHLTNEVMKLVALQGIEMIRLPPYSPELNPIEQYWKNIKQWLGTRIFYDRQQLVREVQKALRNPKFIPKISHY